MEKFITADNTETFLNKKVQQTYHSQTGAVEEALKKYAIPCKVKELAQQGEIKILDVCFGLGYNSAMAIDVALKENPNCKIEVIGLENDPEIIKKIQEVNPPIKFFQYYKKLTPTNLEFKEGNVSVKVILDDAKKTAKDLQKEFFDTVFFDPFSPKATPEMWEVELFAEMY